MAYQKRISRGDPGCLIFVLDQSGSMGDTWGAGGQTKAEILARCVNDLIYTVVLRCTSGDQVKDYFRVGVIGYSDSAYDALHPGQPSFSNRSLVSMPALADSFMRIEVAPGHPSDLEVVPLLQPTWIQPRATGRTAMCEALDVAVSVLREWVIDHPQSFPPIVFNVTDAMATDGDPRGPAEDIRELATQDGNALLFNVHISRDASAGVLFPQKYFDLGDSEYARLLFDMSSILPDVLVDAAKDAELTAGAGSRAFAHNANVAQLVQILDLGSSVAFRLA